MSVLPGQLIATMADVLDLPEATVFQFDRSLVAAGIRKTHGRGRSARSVTTEDAANLLIAIAAAPISGSAIKDSAQYCKLFGALPASNGLQLENWPKTLRSRYLTELPEGHELRHAIAALISAAAVGDLDPPDTGEQEVGDFLDVTVTIRTPSPDASIEFLHTSSLLKVSLGYRPLLPLTEVMAHGGVMFRKASDLGQSREFSEFTIRALGNLFKSPATSSGKH
jgi:hypothetical protein